MRKRNESMESWTASPVTRFTEKFPEPYTLGRTFYQFT